MKTKYTAGQRIRATSSTATGIITSATRVSVTWKWDHAPEQWSGTPQEFAEIARINDDKSALKLFLNALYGKTVAPVMS